MHRDDKRFYAILQLDPSATDEDLRIAFRRRAKELHPDAETGNAETFIWLKRAYDTLSDPEQRSRYDRACQTASARRDPAMSTPRPDVIRRHVGRPGGIGFVRYAIAFVIMAALSIGGVQAMIALFEAPPSIQTRAMPAVVAETPAPGPAAPEATRLPGSSKSGFWEAAPATPAKP